MNLNLLHFFLLLSESYFAVQRGSLSFLEALHVGFVVSKRLMRLFLFFESFCFFQFLLALLLLSQLALSLLISPQFFLPFELLLNFLLLTLFLFTLFLLQSLLSLIYSQLLVGITATFTGDMAASSAQDFILNLLLLLAL